jgi:hypothetical protein
MELLCPHCFKRVAIPDEHAGQIVACPLCAQKFGAPALSPKPVSAPAAPPPLQTVGDTYGVSAAHAPPPPLPLPVPPPTAISEKPLPPVPKEEPLPPPGEYTHLRTWRLRPEVTAVAGPASLVAIFLLSFFPWHTNPAANLWRLGFGDGGNALFLASALLTLCLAMPLSIAALLLNHRVFQPPPALRPWLPWKSLILAGLVAAGLVPLGFDYFDQIFYGPNVLAVALMLAVRLQIAALVLFLADFWLQRRHRRNMPLPSVEIRW